jgi:hypothetical protein
LRARAGLRLVEIRRPHLDGAPEPDPAEELITAATLPTAVVARPRPQGAALTGRSVEDRLERWEVPQSKINNHYHHRRAPGRSALAALPLEQAPVRPNRSGTNDRPGAARRLLRDLLPPLCVEAALLADDAVVVSVVVPVVLRVPALVVGAKPVSLGLSAGAVSGVGARE